MAAYKTGEVRLHARLDAARGIAALAVLLDHAYATFIARICGADSLISLIAGIAGQHAVVVFFLLSGHLITRSIFANIRRNGTFDAREYLLSRLTRIYPPLIGSIALCFLIWIVMFGLDLPGARIPFGLPGDAYAIRNHYTIDLREILPSLTMRYGLLQVNGPLWSLYIEFQMYVFAMSVGIWCCGDRVAKCWATLLAMLAISFLLTQPAMACIWLIGGATVMLERFRTSWIALGVVAGGVVLVLEARHTHLDGAFKEAVLDQTIVAFSVVYASALFFIKTGATPSVLVRTARFSYSLYIIHFPILLLVLGLTQDWTGHALWRALTVFCLTVPLVTIVARQFAVVVENQPLFKRWLSGEAHSRVATRSTTVLAARS